MRGTASGPIAFVLFLFLTFGAERAGVDADIPERSDRIVEYSIEAKLVPEERAVLGTQRLVWRNTSSQPADRLYFHLYLNAFREGSSFMKESKGTHRRRQWDKDYPGELAIQSMKMGTGEELWKDGNRKFESPNDQNPTDRTVAWVKLPRPVPSGETVTLNIRFKSTFPRVFARTGWAGDPKKPSELFFMVAQWFPKIAVLEELQKHKPAWNCHQFHRNTEFFADFGVYDVSITVPESFLVGATGSRVSTKKNGDGTVTHKHVQADVHDFVWCASPHFVERVYDYDFDTFVAEAPDGMGERMRRVLNEAAARRGVPPETLKPAPVKIRFLLQPDHNADAVWKRFQWSVSAALSCYGIWFGKYPYPVLTVMDPPAGGTGAGGMEYPTLITVWGDRLAPAYSQGMEGVTIHEFGHQYFYGLMASNEFEEAWLDEGMTSFTDERVAEEAYGAGWTRTRYGPFTTPYLRPVNPPSVFGRLHEFLKLTRVDVLLDKIRPWKKPSTALPNPAANALFQYGRDLPFVHFQSRLRIPQPYGTRNWFMRVKSRDSMVLPGWEYASRGDYGVNSYSKPTLLLYSLRGFLGPALFDRMYYAYTERFRFKHPKTSDFVGVLKEFVQAASTELPADPLKDAGGGDGGNADKDKEEKPEPPAAKRPAPKWEAVSAFLDAMLKTGAFVDAAILSAESEKGESGPFHMWTVRVQRRGPVPLPLEIVAVGMSGEQHRWTWLPREEKTTQTFRALRPEKLRSVRIGPRWIGYVDSDLSNNARLVGSSSKKPALVQAARWTFWVEDVVRSYARADR